MGFRFRKSISIIPGVRINLSNGAPSLSVGPRGASLSFGKRGTYANLGLPGTGLSYRTRIDRIVRERQNNRAQANPGTTFTSMYVSQTSQNSSIITAIRHFPTLRTPLTSTRFSLNQVASGGFSGGSLCSMKIEATIWH